MKHLLTDDKDNEHLEHLLKTLVAFKTVDGDKQSNRELLDYVDMFVQKRGMHVTRYEWNGYESLVATTRPENKKPKVMLAAHADVVPGAASMFNLRKENGKYLGRGVLDMKFAIAAYLRVIDEIQDNIHDYDIGLMITSDEEVGGHNGVAKLVDEGYIPEVCILPDGGDNWQIQTSSKGVWLIKISADGRAAHGSRPWLGDNALDKLIVALAEIKALFPKYLHPDTNTISLSTLNGGEAMNQVPGQAAMQIDVRTINSIEHNRLYDEIIHICRRHKLDYAFLSSATPTSFNLGDPYIAPFAKLITQETGTTVRGYHALGASDVRYFAPYGVPCISVYPLGGNLHADDEWLDAASLKQFKHIIRLYLDKIACQGLKTLLKQT